VEENELDAEQRRRLCCYDTRRLSEAEENKLNEEQRRQRRTGVVSVSDWEQ